MSGLIENLKEEQRRIKYGIKLDQWQSDLLDIEGNITIRSGRQVGKSTIISIKAYEFAINNPNVTVLVVAASQRQSSYLFEKIRGLCDIENTEKIEEALKTEDIKSLKSQEKKNIEEKASIYDEKPTLSRIIFKNGSRIYCLPTGKTGVYIRGYTIDLLIADEAAYIAEAVWTAILPMLAVSKKLKGFGWIILLSTPFGKGGYFYESHKDDDFHSVHISSEDCTRISKKFLIKEKQRLSKIEYAQEYLGEFTEEWNQFFPTELIKKCSTLIDWRFEVEYNPRMKYYIGVDIARYGNDETAYCIIEYDDYKNRKKLRLVKIGIHQKKATTQVRDILVGLHEKYNFQRIFIDDGGVGGGVTDMLVEKLGKSKVKALNNASRAIDEKRRKKLLKEDMYSNTLILMEQGNLELIAKSKIVASLRSITFEYTGEKNLYISGKYSHLTEALVRACWCTKDKGLKLFLN